MNHRGSTLIHTDRNDPYLISSVTGAAGVYWTRSEAVCSVPFPRCLSTGWQLSGAEYPGRAFLVIALIL